ncbi:MAG: AtzH-like domain-containing protein [Terriglobales bacterium]
MPRNCAVVAVVLTLLLSSFSVIAQNSKPDVTSSIEQVLLRQQEAWNHHDLETFMSGYWKSPDLTFFSGAEKRSGWQSTLERYRQKYQSEGQEMGQLEFSDLNIQELAPDAAFVRGAWHLTMSNGKKPHGLFTLVFRKFPDGWKIVHDHTSAADR